MDLDLPPWIALTYALSHHLLAHDCVAVAQDLQRLVSGSLTLWCKRQSWETCMCTPLSCLQPLQPRHHSDACRSFSPPTHPTHALVPCVQEGTVQRQRPRRPPRPAAPSAPAACCPPPERAEKGAWNLRGTTCSNATTLMPAARPLAAHKLRGERGVKDPEVRCGAALHALIGVSPPLLSLPPQISHELL